MGTYKNKAYPLRIDNELMEKIRIISEQEDRPISRQLERIIRDYIEDYESEHGSITIQKTINIDENHGTKNI